MFCLKDKGTEHTVLILNSSTIIFMKDAAAQVRMKGIFVGGGEGRGGGGTGTDQLLIRRGEKLATNCLECPCPRPPRYPRIPGARPNCEV